MTNNSLSVAVTWLHNYLDKKVAAMEETCGKGALKSKPTTACIGPERCRPSTFTSASNPMLWRKGRGRGRGGWEGRRGEGRKERGGKEGEGREGRRGEGRKEREGGKEGEGREGRRGEGRKEGREGRRGEGERMGEGGRKGKGKAQRVEGREGMVGVAKDMQQSQYKSVVLKIIATIKELN